MIEDKRSARIRQTPKYMEKMLLVNHKEEQGLQRRLENITTDSRIKGRQLDMERIKVRNEWRFYSRLNYPSVAPLLGQIPVMIQRGHQKSREPTGVATDYLLREYRRNSQVIPSILSTVGKEMENHQNKVKENEAKEALRKERLDAVASANSPLSQRHNNKKRFEAKHSTATNSLDESQSQSQTLDEYIDDEVVEAGRISTLVREITKIRNDMLANKKIDLMRSRVSFPEMLRNLQEKDKSGSESQTYTDGTCVLLRRKMQRMRKHSGPEPEVEVYTLLGQSSSHGNSHNGNGVSSRATRKRHSISHSVPNSPASRLPSISTNKNVSSMSAIARLDVLENDEKELKRQLEDQERHQTELKVAIESKKYQRIQERVGEFLQENKVRATLPLMYETNNAA